ncbi:MAG: tetraacyldisaccharide 4'-kinase [Betaproteobacteria bacterium]|nr:tetraacyldisaccharide 4'-kinase [Betaproteobacteria bacterium]
MQRLGRLWYRPPLLAYGLLPLAWLYRSVDSVRRRLYRRGVFERTRLPVPVVIVGNITAGGSGKTPLVQWLARRLGEAGRRTAIVSRSYAASARVPARVHAGDDPAIRGDEAVLLAATLACPVWSGPDRRETARALLRAHPEIDTLLCDDGLQHYALERDVEIAVVDAARGFGNALPLPAGPLREPLSRLGRVDAIVMNGEQPVAGLPAAVPRFVMTLRGTQFRNLVDPNRVQTAQAFKHMRLAAVAGIGNPARFFAHLRNLDLAFDARSFPDHHRYRADDLRFAAADAILMTEKDAIKCAAFRDPRMWALPVAAETSDALVQLICERIGHAAGLAPAAGHAEP